MARNKDEAAKTTPATDRRATTDRREQARRTGQRRKQQGTVAVERRAGAERRKSGPDAERRKVQRRINEYVLKPEVLEFINAVNEFKAVHQKPFPTWSEIYEIFVSLGYARTE